MSSACARKVAGCCLPHRWARDHAHVCEDGPGPGLSDGSAFSAGSNVGGGQGTAWPFLGGTRPPQGILGPREGAVLLWPPLWPARCTPRSCLAVAAMLGRAWVFLSSPFSRAVDL